MKKNLFYAFLFLTFLLLVALGKLGFGILGKILRLRKKEQVFNLLSKYRFIEITGSSGKGKSGLLSHLFKHLQGVKFTNLPTPQSTFTMEKKTGEIHLSGKGSAPHKFYYFLDDIDTGQQGSQKELGSKGYEALKSYIIHSGKLGGTGIGTNNGIVP